MASTASSKTPSRLFAGAGEEERPKPSGYSPEIALVASLLLAASGHLLIKAGLNATAVPVARDSLALQLLRYLLSPMVILGLVVYAVGTATWVVAVAKRDISYLFPITSMNYVLVTLGGMWLFGEAVPPGRWLGIMIVMLGVVLMQMSTVGRKQ